MLTVMDYTTRASFSSLLKTVILRKNEQKTNGFLDWLQKNAGRFINHCSLDRKMASCDVKYTWFLVQGLKKAIPLVLYFKSGGQLVNITIIVSCQIQYVVVENQNNRKL